MSDISFAIAVVIGHIVVYGPYAYVWYRFMTRGGFSRAAGMTISIVAVQIGVLTVIGQIDPATSHSWIEMYAFFLFAPPVLGGSMGMLAGMVRILSSYRHNPCGLFGIDVEAEKAAIDARIARRSSDLAFFTLETEMIRLKSALEWQKTVDRYGMRALANAPRIDTPEDVLADIRAYMEENWERLEGRRDEIVALKRRVRGAECDDSFVVFRS